MPNSRVFVQSGSQAGVFHVVSRVVDRTFRLGEREKDEMVRLMKALAAFHQVEILTYCLMSNHFHLLVRVPERPEGFDLPLDEVLALLERAIGRTSMKVVRSQLEIYGTNGSEEAIDDWRRQQLSRMFCQQGLAVQERFAA